MLNPPSLNLKAAACGTPDAAEVHFVGVVRVLAKDNRTAHSRNHDGVLALVLSEPFRVVQKFLGHDATLYSHPQGASGRCIA
jgi:hypothetical protein